MIAPCTCGHSRDDHDYGYGTCTNCECNRFEEDSRFMECASVSNKGPDAKVKDVTHLPVTRMIVARLGVLAGRGDIAKTGKTRDARWAVA